MKHETQYLLTYTALHVPSFSSNFFSYMKSDVLPERNVYSIIMAVIMGSWVNDKTTKAD